MIVFSHRPSKLQVQEHYVFNDDKGDVFEREPYVAWFRAAVDGTPVHPSQKKGIKRVLYSCIRAFIDSIKTPSDDGSTGDPEIDDLGPNSRKWTNFSPGLNL